MNDQELREIIIEQDRFFAEETSGHIQRELLEKIKGLIKLPHAVIISGIRRSGKSTFLKQIQKKYYPDDYYYFNFEDERLLNFKAQDFNRLYELLLEIKGLSKTFFLDEVQNIDKWETFIRRMYDRGFKFFITGSNASLLSKEIGTKLTGRHQSIELFPFSFKEYLKLKKIDFEKRNLLQTENRAGIKKYFKSYLEKGGMPEYARFGHKGIIRKVYDDILYRDIAARYGILDTRSLREVAFNLLNNTANLISYNKLKKFHGLGSVNTIKKYIDYLENSYMLFVLNKFSFSVKEQLIAAKKIYCVDSAFFDCIAFHFTQDKGDFLENLVYINLRRNHNDIFYYKTREGGEVDFVVREKRNKYKLIQVSFSLKNDKTYEREVKALHSALKELNGSMGYILTESEEDVIKEDRKTIIIKPVYKWLLEEC